MPHKHAWRSAPDATSGIYCAGHFANGEPCKKRLATLVSGMFVMSYGQFAAIVGEVQAVHCPDCGTDNRIESPVTRSAAVLIAYGSTAQSVA